LTTAIHAFYHWNVEAAQCNAYLKTLPSPAGPWGSPRSLDTCTVSRASGRDGEK